MHVRDRVVYSNPATHSHRGKIPSQVFAVDNTDINILSLNTADNWFHLASALVGLVIAVLPARTEH